jgi:RNA polymerase sigma factor (TIGR02999 family)
MPLREDVTRLLSDLSAGKEGASKELFELVYDELHGLARSYMRQERHGHTLQTTALVHEAYLKLGGEKDVEWESRAHFFRVAARAMRRVLIDYARQRGREKRPGDHLKEPLEKIPALTRELPAEILDIDAALSRLAEIDSQTSQVVELRFFGGLTVEQTAKVMEISSRTVKQEWRIARAWLQQEIAR